MPIKIKAALAALFFLSQPVLAGQLTQVKLEPIAHVEATLVIVAADGTERSYTPADLEQFQTYSLNTATPWRDDPADFQGVLLNDILAANGLDVADAIIVTAENDYSTEITRALMSSVNILVATRVNGAAHTRRERGPIQFIIDMDEYNASELTSSSNLVWMAARIEAQS